jgi:hypothetical protein
MDNEKYLQDDDGGNVATGKSVGLSSGNEIALSVILGKRTIPFLYSVRLCQYDFPSELADVTATQFPFRT